MTGVQLKKSSSDDQGQAMVEYALILALVAAVVFGALSAIGPSLTPIFQAVASGF